MAGLRYINLSLIVALSFIPFIFIYSPVKFLVPILPNVNEFKFHDTFLFAEVVSKLDTICIMTSWNVESLFTNIPLDKTALKGFLKFVYYESYFTFDKETLIYQIFQKFYFSLVWLRIAAVLNRFYFYKKRLLGLLVFNQGILIPVPYSNKASS